jgi:hypothetical protein
MNNSALRNILTAQLVARFVQIGIKQDQALFDDKIGVFSQLYKEKAAIVSELKAREGDQRRALIELYSHPNLQVQLNAATATLAIDPAGARRVLEAIEASRMPDHALRAGMTLSALDDGTFKPT